MPRSCGNLSLTGVPWATVLAVQEAAAKAGLTARAWVLRAVERNLEAETRPFGPRYEKGGAS